MIRRLKSTNLSILSLFLVLIPVSPTSTFSLPFSLPSLFLRKTFSFPPHSPPCPKPSFKQNSPFFLFLALSRAYRFLSRAYRFVSRTLFSISFLWFFASPLCFLLFLLSFLRSPLLSLLSLLFLLFSGLSFSVSYCLLFAECVWSWASSPYLYTSIVAPTFSFAVSDPSFSCFLFSRAYFILSRPFFFLSRPFFSVSPLGFQASFLLSCHF